mgnify:CR=1 FL=1
MAPIPLELLISIIDRKGEISKSRNLRRVFFNLAIFDISPGIYFFASGELGVSVV